MMGKKILFSLILLSIVASSCQKVEALIEATFKSEELLNLSYGNSTGNTMDVYLPAGRSENNTKIVFLIHGGSWSGGDKSELTQYASTLRLKGFAVVNLNYRLINATGNVTFADQLKDINDAVNFACSKASEWRVSNKIGLVGVSAGAHLALLYTYANNADNKVKTVVSLAGPTNLSDARNINSQMVSVVEKLVGSTLSSNPQAFAAVSPISRVNESSKPTLIFHGKKDTVVPVQQSIDLKAKLDEMHVNSKLVIYEDAGHEVVNDNNFASFIEELEDWLTININ